MNITIRKIGNSDGVIIPKDDMKSLRLKAGDTLELTTDKGSIALKPLDDDLAEQLEAARLGMQKYRIALRELAK